MRMKQGKKPTRSIRYLLSADGKLQRISLKRISARVKRVKKNQKPRRSIRLKNPAPAKDSTGSAWAIGSRARVLGLICVMATATGAMIAARPFHREDVSGAGVSTVATPPLRQAPTTSATETNRLVVDSAPKVEAADSTPKADGVESAPQADAPNLASVAIAGCVDLDDETFWLKDTSGTDAPKSRSWKSGFLKKRPAPIALVDADRALRLQGYVGQRVVATGTLENREMRAHSLRLVAASCS